MTKPVFAGLVFTEDNQLVETTYVGAEPMYVVNDLGFRRHIPSEQVDRQVIGQMLEQLRGHEDLVVEQTSKLTGQDDIFSRAAMMQQIKDIGKQIDQVLEVGLPSDAIAYMGMVGFRIVINFHGEVIEVIQPAGPADPGEDE